MQKDIENILVDIIRTEMDLPLNYGKNPTTKDIIPCCIVYNQNLKLFNTDRLQITVRTVSSKDYSNRTTFIENPNPTDPDGSDAYLEIQDINQSRLIQVDVYSRNNDARSRFWEVSAALNSVYAQNQMEVYQFKIGRITNGINISGIDGGSDINRFTLSFNVLIHFQKSKPVAYYDKFQCDYYTEKGKIGQINIGD